MGPWANSCFRPSTPRPRLYSYISTNSCVSDYFFGREEDFMCAVIPVVGSYLFTANLVAVHPIAVDRLVAVYLPMR